MPREMTVRNLLLCPPPLTLPPDATVSETLSLMIQREVNHIPLCDDAGRFLGLVSSNALLRILMPKEAPPANEPDEVALDHLIDQLHDSNQRCVGELVDASVRPVELETPILEAARRLSDTPAPLPVVNRAGQLVGLLGRRLLLTYLIDKGRPH